MSANELIALAICAPAIALGLGYIIGGRHERSYWQDHARHGGYVFHRGALYRVTKVTECNPKSGITTTGEPSTEREPKRPTR